MIQPGYSATGGLLALPTLAAHTNTDTQPSQNYQGAVFSAAAAAKASPTEAHNPETGRSRPAEPAGQNAAGAASAQAASAQHIGSRLQQQRDASHDQPAVNATQQMSVQLNDSTPAHWRAQNQTGDSNSVASQTQQSKQGYSPTLPYTKPPAAVTKTATLQWASNPLAVGSSHLDAPPQQVRVAPKTGALQPDKNMAEGLVLGSAIPQGKQAAAVSGSAQLNLGSSAGRLAANSSLLSSAAKVVKATQIPDSSQTSGKQADSLQFPVQPGPRTSKQGPAPQLPKQATLPLLAVDAAQHKHASPSGIAAVPVVTSKTAAVSATGINSSAAAQQTKQPDPAKPVRALLTHPETSAACGVTKAAGTPAQHHNPPHPAATSTATAAKAPVAAPAAQARVAAPAAQAQVAAPTPDAKALQAQAAREQAKAATAAAQQPGSGLTATAAQQSEKLAVLPDAALTSTSHSQSGTTSSEAAPAFSDRIPALLKKYNKRKWDEQPPSTAAAAASNSISEGLQIPTQQGHPLASLPLSTTVPSQAGHGQVHAAPKRAKHDQVVHSPAAAMQVNTL